MYDQKLLLLTKPTVGKCTKKTRQTPHKLFTRNKVKIHSSFKNLREHFLINKQNIKKNLVKKKQQQQQTNSQNNNDEGDIYTN